MRAMVEYWRTWTGFSVGRPADQGSAAKLGTAKPTACGRLGQAKRGRAAADGEQAPDVSEPAPLVPKRLDAGKPEGDHRNHFLAQEYEEMTHVKMGEYIVGRYATTAQIQFRCLWASYHNLRSLRLALEDFVQFVEGED
jgi:hypothetical protein